MGKKKIADSIIIRVGAGIREIPREPVEITESQKPVNREPDFEQAEDMRPLGSELDLTSGTATDKNIN